MVAGRIAVNNNYCRFKTKTNSNTNGTAKPGFINPSLVVLAFLALAGVYVYFINSSANKGFEMRNIEKEITQLKKENESLRIREAELKSLYHIEESTKGMNMAETMQVSYIEEKSPVAMK